jgi:hypothetical protein
LTVPSKVSLFVLCFVDQLLPEVAVDTVKVLRRIGYALEFPEDQTGCGQPAFNTGYSNEAVPWAEHFVKVFKDAEMVAWPSGSGATMVRNFYPELLAASSLQKLDRNSFACVIQRSPAAPPISRRLWCRAYRDRDGYSSFCRPEPRHPEGEVFDYIN